jgi:soluble lytic murein transglycosylase
VILILAAFLGAQGPSAVERLAKGAQLYADHEYAAAMTELAPARDIKLHAQDYVLWFYGQSAYYAGDKNMALDAFHRLAQMHGSRLINLGAWREADTLFVIGRGAEAARLYENLLKHNVAGGDPAVALFHMAEAAQQAGRKDVAAAVFRRVHIEHPAHPLADLALERIQQVTGKPADITADEHIRRAATLAGGRKWDRALDELGLVPPNAPQAVRDEADFAIGMTKYRTRHDYQGSADKLLGAFERLQGDRAPQALFHGARALSRSDNDDKAIEYYHEVVRRFPKSRWAPEAQFLIGWLEFNRARYDKALPGLTELIARYPKSEFADDAMWYLGFSQYLLGRLDEAVASFQRLEKYPGEYTKSKARYWTARVLERRGLGAQSIDAYKAIVTDYPLNWYALLSMQRLAKKGVKVGPFGLAGRGDAPVLGALEPQVAAEAAVAKADELLAAGLRTEAGEELHAAEFSLIRKYTGARALPVLFDRYRRSENWNRVYLLAETYSGRALKMPPQGEGRKWWESAYPLAYRDLVEKYRDLGDNPEYYLFAVMRKESGFNPHDVSYADAIGLLQMIPATSKRVSEQIKHTYTDDVLYEPKENVQYGSWYIGHLLSKFKKQIPLGAGAFNAGPKPMMKWIAQHGKRPMDEFVELCAYTQTREYMKLVTDNYAHYLFLYGGKVYPVPLTVDRTILDDGIEY